MNDELYHLGKKNFGSQILFIKRIFKDFRRAVIHSVLRLYGKPGQLLRSLLQHLLEGLPLEPQNAQGVGF
jgi:hypothetical protein